MHELVVSSGLQPGDFAGCGQVTPSELSVEPIPSSFNGVPVYARPYIHAYTRFFCLNVYVYMYACMNPLGTDKGFTRCTNSPTGEHERFTFGSVRHKKGDILFGLGNSGEW